MATTVDPTYQDKVQELLRKIIEMYYLHGKENQIIHLFRLITRESLSYPMTESLPPFSRVCTDGTPIQFSASLGRGVRDSRELRYVTEICKPTMQLPERVKLTRKRIPLLLEAVEASNLIPKIDEILDVVLPATRLSPGYSNFGIWIGVQHGADKDPILKFYLNLMWRNVDPWQLFIDASGTIGAPNSRIESIRGTLGNSCYPNSMGVECGSDGFGRVKLYLRGYDLSLSETRDLLRDFNMHESETDLTLFHSTFLKGSERYHPFSTILSIGIPVDEDEACDMKFEISPVYYVTDDEETFRLIASLALALGIDITPYKQMMDLFSKGMLIQGLMNYHDIIGIGLSQNGPRLTTYLRPNLTKRGDSFIQR